MAFEQQLAKNSSLIYELLEKSRWKKKISFPGRRKEIARGENGLKNEEEELVQQIKAHKDDIVAKLLGMVSVYKKENLTNSQLMEDFRLNNSPVFVFLLSNPGFPESSGGSRRLMVPAAVEQFFKQDIRSVEFVSQHFIGLKQTYDWK